MVQPVMDVVWANIYYLAVTVTLGALSALAALLGDPDRVITRRILFSYILSGGLASLGLALLLIEKYGFSYFLIGISTFAGYKAFDVLTLLSLGVTTMVRRIAGTSSTKKKL
jgi:uncharacterized membrane protein